MRLLSIEVKGCKCFRNRVRLDDMDPGINVIYGPNECGKSTLIMSLARALFDKCTTVAREIEEMRPWNTRLAPEIAVELVLDKQYKLEKGFLDNPYARLYEMTDNGYQLFADGDRAEAAIREMLGSTLPGRGPTKLEHWGIARLLWFPQDQQRFSKPTLEGSLQDRLSSILGVTGIDETEAKLIETIGRRYGDIFTEKRRSYRAGSDIKILMDEIDETEKEIRDTEHKLQDIEEDVARLERLATDIRDLEERKRDIEKELEDISASVEEVKRLRAELKVAETELGRLNERHAALYNDRQAVRDLKKEIGLSEQDIAHFVSELKSVDDLVASLGQREVELREELGAEKDRLAAARNKRERNQQLSKAVAMAAELGSIKQKLDKVADLTRQLDEERERRRSMLVVNKGDLERAHKLNESIRDLEAKLRATGLTLSVEAEQEVDVCCFVGTGKTEKQSARVHKGEKAVFAGATEATLLIPGVVSIRATTGASEVVNTQTALEAAKREFRELLGRYGVRDVTALEQTRVRAQAADDRILHLQEAIKALAGDKEDKSGLEKAIAMMETALDHLLEELEIGKDQLSGIQVQEDATLKNEVARLEKAVNNLETELKRCNESLIVANKKKADIEVKRAGAEQKLSSARLNLERLLLKYKGGENELEEIYEAVGRDIDIQRQKVNGIKAKLPDEMDDPEKKQQRLQRALEKVSEEHKSASMEMARVDERLKSAGVQGLYSQKARLEERLAVKKQRLQREKTRAKALSLLCSLFELRQARSSEALVKPVEDKITAYFASVRGKGGARVRFSKDLTLDDIEVDGNLVVSADLFSAGAREQLYVAARLAVGEILAQDNRYLVVLDDALVFTDRYRHDRMLDLIQNASKRLQIVILTSHADKFDALPAKFYDLEQLKAGEVPRR